MTTNRLATSEKPGLVTVDTLEELAGSLNQEHWVRNMGRHYFVSREAKGDKIVHALAWQVRRA